MIIRKTLLVNSKTLGKAVLYTTFEGQRDRGHASGDTHSYGVGDGRLRINQQSHDLLYLCAE
jgi:hypothetical protein